MRVPSHCLGKQAFDRATANRVVRETRKEALQSYLCDACDHWHVGKPRSGRRAVKTNRMREFGGDQ